MSEIVRFEEPSIRGELRQVDPAARGVEIAVRPATAEDFAFIDALHKAEADKVGFMPAQAFYKRIEQGNVLVAEATGMSNARMANVEQERSAEDDSAFVHSGFDIAAKPVGYCMGVDRYMKQDHLGVIYHMAVAQEYRRMNVAAAMLQAQFEKSAYGVRLYCCWCKQSLEANRFWEAMGFVPLAFRAAGRSTIEHVKKKTGSTKGAVHLFWQKPIRVEDAEDARRGNFRGWWYPYETNGGAMAESRVILPLPPEVSWDEATPVVLPGAERRAAQTRSLEEKVEEVSLREKEAKKAHRKGRNAKGPGRQDAKGAKEKKRKQSRAVMPYGFGVESGFGQPAAPAQPLKPDEAAAQAEATAREHELARIKEEKDAAKSALKAAQRKSDPELVAFARDLRDRWQEHVAAQPGMLGGKLRGKYDVGRMIEGAVQDLHVETLEVIDEEPTPGEVKRLDAA